jgi:hypothetical protein
MRAPTFVAFGEPIGRSVGCAAWVKPNRIRHRFPAVALGSAILEPPTIEITDKANASPARPQLANKLVGLDGKTEELDISIIWW